MVNLDCEPPLGEVAMLGSNPLRVYKVLFDAAKADNRGECGGTTDWTIKGLANELGHTRRTISNALDKLADAGFIQIIGEEKNKGCSNNTVWRVTHPKMLDAVRYAIEVMGDKPSERLAKMRTKQQKVDTSKYRESQSYEW